MKYLVSWKGFTTESNIWEKEQNLENTKKSSSRVWGEDEYWSKKIEKVELSRRTRL